MRTQVLTGCKSDIAEKIARIDGNIHEVIVLIEEPGDADLGAAGEDIFAEMEPYMVKAGGADYSRESL